MFKMTNQINGVEFEVTPEYMANAMGINDVKRGKAIRSLINNSMVGDYTDLTQRLGGLSAQFLNQLMSVIGRQQIIKAPEEHKTLIKLAFRKVDILSYKKEKAVREMGESNTLKCNVSLHEIKDSHYFLKGSRMIEVEGNLSHAKGEGWILEGNQTVNYDSKWVELCWNNIKKSILQDLKNTDDTEWLLEELDKPMLMNGHRIGAKVVDRVYRSYYGGYLRANPYSVKLVRACMVDTNAPTVCWKDIKDHVLSFYGELVGVKAPTWTKTLQMAEEAFMSHVQSWDICKVDYSDYEQVWAARLVEEYVKLGQPNDSTVVRWSIPVEVDQHASVVGYYGAILGSYRLMKSANVISSDGDTRYDAYTSLGENRLISKLLAMPCAYGASTGGKHKAERILLNKKEWTKKYPNALKKTSGGSVIITDPKIGEIIKTTWSNVTKELYVRFAEFLTYEGKKFYEYENNRSYPVVLSYFNGDRQTIYPKHIATVECEPSLDNPDGKVEKAMNKKTAVAVLNYELSTNKWKWMLKEKEVPMLFELNWEEFGRSLPTALVHHQDALTMDGLVYKLRTMGAMALSIHDACIVNPAYAHIVHEHVQSRLYEIYKNRKELLDSFLKNFGSSWEALPFEFRGEDNIPEWEFRLGHAMK